MTISDSDPYTIDMATDTIETYDYKGAKIEIDYDTDCENPRTAWDNLGKLWLRSYGNCTRLVVNETDIPDYLEVDGTEHNVQDLSKSHVEDYLKAHGYIYVDVCLRSGDHGFNVIHRKNVLEEYGWKILTRKRIAQIEEYLRNEVDTYQAWCLGECYGYRVTVPDDSGEEHEDSCWGFVGEIDYCKTEAQNVAEALVKRFCTPQLEGLELVGVGG